MIGVPSLLTALAVAVCIQSGGVQAAFVPSTKISKSIAGVTATTSTRTLRMAELDVDFGKLDGTDLKIGIIKARWNKKHVDNLITGLRDSLKECNVTDDNIFETEVPGSFELPMAARFLALSGTVDAIICCGVLVKGDTYHFEYICEAVSSGIMSVGLQTNVPVIFGVLTCANEDQVIARSTGANNHGAGWGKTAVEMSLLRRDALGKKKGGQMGFGSPAPLKESGAKSTEKIGFF